METIIVLNSIEQKTTRSDNPKTFWSATTNLGKMSIWEKPIADSLALLINKGVKIDYEERNGYKTITKFIGEADATQAQTPSATNNDDRYKRASMMISYAKDLVIAGKVELKNLKETARELYNFQDELVVGE
jgi:hypothetical protein